MKVSITKEIRSTYQEDLRLTREASEAFRRTFEGDPVTKLVITLADIDRPQRIDETRQWQGVMDGYSDPNQAVFIGFYAGDSPPAAEEIAYDGMIETMWVYKTNYTVQELKNGLTTPKELFDELMFEQPNIEIAGLCKYVRDIPS